MKYTINGKEIECDDSIYYDYTTRGLSKINFPGILSGIESGKIPTDNFAEFLYELTRWVVEAPRKRKYRNLMIDVPNVHIMSGENFFVGDENGDEIIDGLERTGNLAVYLREELFGLGNIIPLEEYGKDYVKKT